MKRNKKIIGVLTALLSIGVTTPAFAAVAILDTSFSSDGFDTQLNSNPSYAIDNAYAIAVQSDGKIVAAGSTAPNDTIGQSVVRRYQANGQLDSSFGTSGAVAINYSNLDQNNYFAAVLVQPDGKIVAAGSVYEDDGSSGSTQNILVARFLSDGSPDTSFSADGSVTLDGVNSTPNIDEYANDINRTSDGKYIVSGVSGSSGFVLRLNSDGTLDTNFGTSGITLATATLGGTVDSFTDAAVDANNRILVTGSSRKPATTETDLIVWRYLANGTLDTSFNSAGYTVINDVAGYATARDVGYKVIDDGGRVVVLGRTQSGAGQNIPVLARYTSTGVLDTSFSSDGILTLSTSEYVYAMTKSELGYVLGGQTLNGSNADIALWLVNNSGVLDSTFASDGSFQATNLVASWTDEWAFVNDIAVSGNSVFVAGTILDNLDFLGEAWVVAKILIGNEVVNLPAGSQLTDSNGDPITEPLVGVQTVRLATTSNIPVVELSTDFSDTDLDLSGVTFGTDAIAGKAFVSGLSGTHTLFVPKRTGDTAVYICPDASSLPEVEDGCANQVTYTEADPNVSVVSIGGQDYWRVEGLTGTGGQSVAGLAETGAPVSLSIGIGLIIIASSMYLVRASRRVRFVLAES